VSASAARREFGAGGGWSRSAALEPRSQIGEVRSIEADGGANMNRGELAALDQALDGAGMDMQQVGRFLGREEGGRRGRFKRLRLGTT
jgi:hypothetical protein